MKISITRFLAHRNDLKRYLTHASMTQPMAGVGPEEAFAAHDRAYLRNKRVVRLLCILPRHAIPNDSHGSMGAEAGPRAPGAGVQPLDRAGRPRYAMIRTASEFHHEQKRVSRSAGPRTAIVTASSISLPLTGDSWVRAGCSALTRGPAPDPESCTP